MAIGWVKLKFVHSEYCPNGSGKPVADPQEPPSAGVARKKP